LQFLNDLSGTDISCELFGRHYTCVVPLADFYWTIVLLSCLAMFLYVFCAAYNLVWCAPEGSFFKRGLGANFAPRRQLRA
jgi:hypothetical protein